VLPSKHFSRGWPASNSHITGGGRMKLSDRRLAQRFSLPIPLYIRGWKSQAPEQKVESTNISECGVYFETDTPQRVGAMMQIRLEMPKEITGAPTVEWRCTGKVTRVQPASSPGALLGVSVRFDYYEVSRTTGPIPTLAVSSRLRNQGQGRFGYLRRL
jgi:hypothetical protein